MRILYIDVNCKSGSTGKIVYDLYSQGRADGHETAICYGRGKLVEGENIWKFGLDWETKLHALLTRLTGWTGRFSPLSTRRLLRFIDAFAPDVIHLHEPHAYFMNIAPFFRYVKERDIPLVYTFHCEFAYTGKCGYAYECDRWQTGCGNCPKLKEYPKTLFFDHTAAMWREKKKLLLSLKRVIYTAPSQWLADRAQQSFLSGKDIRVVHNGIDTETVFFPHPCTHLRQKHGLTNEKIVLAVAPDLMSSRKGGRWVLKLAETMKDAPVKFILIGVSDLTESLPDNVIALGRTENQQELAEYYSMADCFVICSERENFPTTCLEAVCCGTPVIGFSTGGTAETAPAPLGAFCGYGDIPALTALLRDKLATPPAQTEFDAIRRHYSSRRMYEEYLGLYRKLLQETKRENDT